MAATVETDTAAIDMEATVMAVAIATEAATAALGAMVAAVATGEGLPVRTTVAAAVVATGGLAPDPTRHAGAGAIPTTTESSESSRTHQRPLYHK